MNKSSFHLFHRGVLLAHNTAGPHMLPLLFALQWLLYENTPGHEFQGKRILNLYSLTDSKGFHECTLSHKRIITLLNESIRASIKFGNSWRKDGGAVVCCYDSHKTIHSVVDWQVICCAFLSNRRRKSLKIRGRLNIDLPKPGMWANNKYKQQQQGNPVKLFWHFIWCTAGSVNICSELALLTHTWIRGSSGLLKAFV